MPDRKDIAILSDWVDELIAMSAINNSLYIALFSTDKELLYANKEMATLLKDELTERFINPSFDKLLTLDNSVPLIFDGFLTLGDYSSDNTSFSAQVFRKENKVLVLGYVNALELIEQNKVMHQLNQEISNLQRALIKEKHTLEHTLTQLSNSNNELEEALKKVSDYKTALDASAIVSITDINGDIKYVNAEFCSISKYSENELVGENQRIVDSGYHTKEFWNDMWETIRSGKVWRKEIRNKAKDGSYYLVDNTIVPFIGKDNKPYQFLSIQQDITREKSLEQNIINSIIYSQEEDREYFAKVIHENLVQTLVGLKFQLYRIESKLQKGDDHEMKNDISSIKNYMQQSIESMKNLATDLMPRAMMQYGIIPSIKSYLQNLNTNSDLKIEFYANNLSDQIEKGIEITMYRAIVAIIEKIKASPSLEKIAIEVNSDEHHLQVKIAILGKINFTTDLNGNMYDNGWISLQKRIELHGGQMIINQNAKFDQTNINIMIESYKAKQTESVIPIKKEEFRF